MNDGVKNLTENAFLPDSRKRKKLDTSKPIDIRLKDEKDNKPIFHVLPKDGVFKQYDDPGTIATNIAVEFLSKHVYESVDLSKTSYGEIIETGLTFFMSPESGQKRSGLLSICPAVLTAMKLWETIPSDSLREKLFANIETGVNAIFKIIFRDNEHVLSDGLPIFDASPYESDAFSNGMNGKSYIDSISWAIPVFLRILNLTKKEEKKSKRGTLVFQDENLRKKAAFLAKWCLRYVNSCLLKRDDRKTPVGWGFTKLDNSTESERSLYFTYAASTVYMSFYSEYESIILAQRILDGVSGVQNEDSDSIHFNLSDKYWENKNGELEEMLKGVSGKLESEQTEEPDDRTAENIEQLENIKGALEVLLDRNNAKKIEMLAEFNDDNRITNEATEENVSGNRVGQVSYLKWNLEKIAEDLWDDVGDKLEDKFMYEDVKASVAENDAIENGGQTNALFTGLLQMGIILNSGYDIKVNRERGKREYEKMQNTMLLHIQKTQRFFDKLEDTGKSFAVDSLILRFMEKLGESEKQSGLSDRALAEKLRKHHIRVCSLTPLLLKTNNLVSEYVIRYPQKQMGESLLRISQKRFLDKSEDDKEKYRWLWESDNYHAISNYYYVSAIFDFYAYYSKYEQVYVKRYEDMRADLLRDLNFTDQVRKYYQEISDEKAQIEAEYEARLETKDKEIAKALAEAKRSEIGDKLVTDVNQVIEDSKYFSDPTFLKKIINGIRIQLAEELVTRYGKDPSEDRATLEKLAIPTDCKDDTLFSLIKALVADIILPSAIEAKKNEGTGLVNDLGKEGLEGVMPADFALNGGIQLIKDGLIDKLFAFMCSPLIWRDQKTK